MRKVNIIPLAGEGIRFVNAGYQTPKPMIEVDDLPMIISSAKCLPDADFWIFICRDEHITNFKIDKLLKKHFPSSLIISINYLTNGQAITCLIAREYLNPDDFLTIGACDNKIDFDINKYQKKIKNVDALVWTFRNNEAVVNNPEMYGWADLNNDGKIAKISCKVPISDTPINDHALIGAFSFKRAEYFMKYSDKIVKKNMKVNNEFYLDTVLDECVHAGLDVEPFEVDKYTCWGTPEDVMNYKQSLMSKL